MYCTCARDKSGTVMASPVALRTASYAPVHDFKWSKHDCNLCVTCVFNSIAAMSGCLD